jgi:adenylate cyclase
MDHFEYRPVGDIVNTATRIEGLNKRLGTRLLASTDVVRGLGGFLTRELGTFLFAGKSQPVTVHEVFCRKEMALARQKDTCVLFAAGLDAFRNRSFEAAAVSFRDAVKTSGGDGPSEFYIGIAERYREKPPDDGWDGVVSIDTK